MSGLYKMQLAMIGVAIAIAMTMSACDSGVQPPANSQTDPGPQTAADTRSDNSAADASGMLEDVPIIAETLPYAEVDEQLVYGHFAIPADMLDPLPGLIVIHERWGLDDGIRALANRIAAQGYVVLAVDLYGGRTASDINAARDLMVEVFENPLPANDNIRQAYQFLVETAQSPRIGALGWSIGGSWALNTAILFPDDLDAVVIYYGQITTNEERLAPIKAPILAFFGGDDPGISTDTVQSFEVVLENLRKDFNIEVYPGVGHAFADPGSTNHDSDAAEMAWTRTLKFLNEHLATDGS